MQKNNYVILRGKILFLICFLFLTSTNNVLLAGVVRKQSDIEDKSLAVNEACEIFEGVSLDYFRFGFLLGVDFENLNAISGTARDKLELVFEWAQSKKYLTAKRLWVAASNSLLYCRDLKNIAKALKVPEGFSETRQLERSESLPELSSLMKEQEYVKPPTSPQFRRSKQQVDESSDKSYRNKKEQDEILFVDFYDYHGSLGKGGLSAFDTVLTPRDAFLMTINITKNIPYITLALKLPESQRAALLSKLYTRASDGEEMPYIKCEYEMFSLLAEHNLLTIGGLLSAVRDQGEADFASSLYASHCDSKLPTRRHDYTVFTGNRLQALKQPLSLCDMFHLIPSYGQFDIYGNELPKALELSDPVPYDCFKHPTEWKLWLLERYFEQHNKIVSANDMLKVLYHPALRLVASAHRLEEDLTGRKRCRKNLTANETYFKMKYTDAMSIQNLSKFGEALGLDESEISTILQRDEDDGYKIPRIFSCAEKLDRLTRENLHYAFENSGNGHLLESLDVLKGISGCCLPQDQPVYLSEEELGEG